MKFNNKKKSYVYIGRFQPFHEGHYRLIKSVLKKNDQILILVMDSFGISKKNPFKFSYVKKKILKRISIEFKGRYKIIKIPVVKSVIYGRKVGYKIQKIKLENNIEKISATNIRKKILIK